MGEYQGPAWHTRLPKLIILQKQVNSEAWESRLESMCWWGWQVCLEEEKMFHWSLSHTFFSIIFCHLSQAFEHCLVNTCHFFFFFFFYITRLGGGIIYKIVGFHNKMMQIFQKLAFLSAPPHMHSWLNHLPILPVNEIIVLAQQSHPPPPFIHLADTKGEEQAVTMEDNKIHSVPNTIEQISYNLNFELESCLLTIGIYLMPICFNSFDTCQEMLQCPMIMANVVSFNWYLYFCQQDCFVSIQNKLIQPWSV